MDLNDVVPQLLPRLERVELGFGGLRQSGELSYFGICLLRVKLELLLDYLLKLIQFGVYARLQPVQVGFDSVQSLVDKCIWVFCNLFLLIGTLLVPPVQG